MYACACMPRTSAWQARGAAPLKSTAVQPSCEAPPPGAPNVLDQFQKRCALAQALSQRSLVLLCVDMSLLGTRGLNGLPGRQGIRMHATLLRAGVVGAPGVPRPTSARGPGSFAGVAGAASRTRLWVHILRLGRCLGVWAFLVPLARPLLSTCAVHASCPPARCQVVVHSSQTPAVLAGAAVGGPAARSTVSVFFKRSGSGRSCLRVNAVFEKFSERSIKCVMIAQQVRGGVPRLVW